MGRVEEFVEAARRFVDWAERGEITDRSAVEVGSALFAAAWSIQDEPLEVADDEVDAEWDTHLGPVDGLRAGYYWQALEPLEVIGKDPEFGLGDSVDDLVSVYVPVMEGLVHWDAGRRDQALWEWVFQFRAHWGEHLVDLLGILHRVTTDDSPS